MSNSNSGKELPVAGAWLEGFLTELRISNRVIQETWGGVYRTGWMNLVIVVTLAAILTIFGCLTLTVLDSQFFVANLGTNMEISVYLKDRAALDDVKVQARVLPYVRQLQVIPKQQAWEEMKKLYEDLPGIENPLPDTLRVKVSQPQYVKATAEQLEQIEGVEKVNYPYAVLSQLQEITKKLSVFGLAFTLFLGCLTLLIINNTIALLIQARGREIEIMRMMGVGNWYIRLPFLFQGAFYGVSGALIAYLPLSWVHQSIHQAFTFFQFSPNPYSLSFVLTMMIVIGLGVGSGGSAMAMRRYLQI